MFSYSQIENEFRAAMADAGIITSEAIIANGKIQRAHVEGDKRGTKNLSYCLHLDGRPSGYFEHWGRIKSNWSLSGKREPMTPAMRQQIEAERTRRQKEQAERHAKAAKTAAYIWRKCKPIGHQSEHPYLVAKRIQPQTLRLSRGALVVPIYSEARELVSLQFIGPNLDAPDNKRLLRGGLKNGCFSPVGDFSNVTKILIAEGYATAASLNEALNLPVLMGVDAGNLEPVVLAARRLFPDAEIIVCADNDMKPDGTNTGVEAATRAAQAVGGRVAIPELDGRKCDFWDVWNELGADTVKAQLFPKQSESHSPRRMFVPLAELIAKPMQTDWLIRDYIEMDSTALLFGESGAGKSFLAVDLALSIATGRDWNGHAVKQGAVFYLAGEGHAGFAKRFMAWAAHTGTDIATVPFFLSTSAIGLPDEATLARLIHEIESSDTTPALIVIDTLARSLIGDENRSDDVGGFIRAIDQIRIRYGCAMLIVHHTGHNNSDRARGSSALKAAMDTELGLTNKAGAKCLEVTKQKNHEPVSPKLFKLQQVPTPWCDEDGNPILSAVMILDGSGQAVKSKKPKLSLRDDAILTSLRRALVSHGVAPSADIKARFGGFDGYANAHRMVVDIEHWRDEAYPVIDADGIPSKKVAFQRGRAKLQNAGYVQTMDGLWWLLDDEPIKRNNTKHTGTDVPTCSGVSGDKAERNGTHFYGSVPVVPSIDTNGGDL